MSLKDFGAEKISGRPLEFIYIIDKSGSMMGQKIQTVNHAIGDVIPLMRESQENNINASIYVRVLTFSNDANWHIGERTLVQDFSWDNNIEASGVTNMAKAIDMLTDALSVENMPERGLPPLLILISDGKPTDEPEYLKALERFHNSPWVKKSVRLAISIGQDAYLEHLESFIKNPEIEPIVAENATKLFQYIKWASTMVLDTVSQTKSQSQDGKLVFQMPSADFSIEEDFDDFDGFDSGDVW